MPGQPSCSRSFSSILFSLTLLALSISSALLVGSARVQASTSSLVFKAHPVQVRPVTHKLSITEQPHLARLDSDIKPVQLACQSNKDPQPLLCYGPYQIRQAYGVSGLLDKNINGQGSTITIIDAYGNSTVQQDLRLFDMAWSLPDPILKVITPYGVRGTDNANAWAAEASLDVEWAHAMAPGATIDLVVAKSSDDTDIYYALKYAVDHNLGDVISLSFGENESCVDPKLRIAEHEVFSAATSKGMTLLAATGDYGSAQTSCDFSGLQEAVSFPANDPLVTAVGGTALTADAVSGQYVSEVAWNEANPYGKATGGGYSMIYAAPAYQHGIIGSENGRAVPDLALNASVNGGVLLYQSSDTPDQAKITVVGGTSVATPELAGIIADGVQMANHRLGQINPVLYKMGQSKSYGQLMNDITSGNNTLLVASIPGYMAGTGWDPVTGWGSPKQAEAFLRALIGM